MKVKEKKKIPLFAIITPVVLVIYMISLVLPLIWSLYTSLKDVVDFQIDSIFPTFPLDFRPYGEAFMNFYKEVDAPDGGT